MVKYAYEIQAKFLEESAKRVTQMEFQSGRYISVIGMEDIIIQRLESTMATHPETPDWTDDYEWARHMFSFI